MTPADRAMQTERQARFDADNDLQKQINALHNRLALIEAERPMPVDYAHSDNA